MAVKQGKKWGHKADGLRKDKVGTMNQVMAKKRKEEQQTSGKKGALTMDDKIRILDLYKNETDTTIIAAQVGRSVDAVRKFIWRHRDSSELASSRMRGGALDLADRVIEQANVDQSLEVLDRLGVLPKVREKGTPQTSFTLVMGNFGDKAAKGAPQIPVPSQKQIEDAIEVEAKVVADVKN